MALTVLGPMEQELGGGAVEMDCEAAAVNVAELAPDATFSVEGTLTGPLLLRVTVAPPYRVAFS
ncbi:MAG: hypothetical protein ACYDCU_04195 [Candidatus Acidiferrales bacterium]